MASTIRACKAQAVSETAEDAVQRGLAHLQAAEFLYETCLFPDAEYTFKHALTHEVAYGTLLQERRKACVARPDRVILVRHRRAEERHDPVAHHLVYRALVAVDRLHHSFEDGIQDLASLLWVAVGQQVHRD